MGFQNRYNQVDTGNTEDFFYTHTKPQVEHLILGHMQDYEHSASDNEREQVLRDLDNLLDLEASLCREEEYEEVDEVLARI